MSSIGHRRIPVDWGVPWVWTLTLMYKVCLFFHRHTVNTSAKRTQCLCPLRALLYQPPNWTDKVSYLLLNTGSSHFNPQKSDKDSLIAFYLSFMKILLRWKSCCQWKKMRWVFSFSDDSRPRCIFVLFYVHLFVVIVNISYKNASLSSFIPSCLMKLRK